MITNDVRYTSEIKYRFTTARAAFNKEKNVHQQIALKLKEATI